MAPATSFLRVHQPAKFGDDLSGFRKTVIMANQEHKVVVGLEGGLAGLGIRGVVPIAQGGKHLGSVEFGLTFGQSFLDDFKSNRHVDIAFHLADGGSFKLFGGTLKGKSFFDAADYGRAAGGDFTIRQAKLDTTPVAALLGPIRDFSGKSLGAVELVMDNADYVASADRAWLLAFGIAALGLVLAAIVGYLIARSISRPIISITTVMRELADGHLDVAVPVSKANDEVGAMVKAVAVFRDNAINFNRLQAEQPRPRRSPKRRSDARSPRSPTISKPASATSSPRSPRQRSRWRTRRARCLISSSGRGSRPARCRRPRRSPRRMCRRLLPPRKSCRRR